MFTNHIQHNYCLKVWSVMLYHYWKNNRFIAWFLHFIHGEMHSASLLGLKLCYLIYLFVGETVVGTRPLIDIWAFFPDLGILCLKNYIQHHCVKEWYLIWFINRDSIVFSKSLISVWVQSSAVITMSNITWYFKCIAVKGAIFKSGVTNTKGLLTKSF